jgi:hypothetical protein
MIVCGVILMKILNLNNIANLYKGVVGTPHPTRFLQFQWNFPTLRSSLKKSKCDFIFIKFFLKKFLRTEFYAKIHILKIGV